MYLSNDQRQICHVSLDNRLLLLSSSFSSCSNAIIIPLVVHEPSTKFATDICGRTSVLCNFASFTNFASSSSFSSSNPNFNSNLSLTNTPSPSPSPSPSSSSSKNNNNNYPVSWIVTSKDSSNTDQIVLVWYPQIETKDHNPLIEELNSCITPSYLCHHIYGWYVSDNVDEAVIWTATPTNNNNCQYKLLNPDGTTYMCINPTLF